MQYRHQLYLILAIFVSLIVSFVSYRLVLYNKVNLIQQENHLQIKNHFERLKNLTLLQKHFGYNGFIHNFKNFVLRKERTYLEKSQQQIVAALDSLLLLEHSFGSEKEQQHLKILHTIIADYQLKSQKIASLPWQKMNSSDIDNLVKVDDSLATMNIASLVDSINDDLGRSLQNTRDDLKVLTEFLLNYGCLILAISLVFCGLLLFFFVRLIKTTTFLKHILKALPEAYILSDLKGRLVQVNDAFSQMFSYSKNECKSLLIEDLMEEKKSKKHVGLRQKFINSEVSHFQTNSGTRFKAKRKNGDIFPVQLSIASFAIYNKKYCVTLINDISELKFLKELSEVDSLTQLYNRRKFNECLTAELTRARRYKHPLSVILIDIDDFKKINDNFGHDKGDEVLVRLSKNLVEHKRKSDVLARWGGEEICCLCTETTLESALAVAENIRQNCALLFADSFKVTLSIGVTDFNLEHDTIREIFKRVDRALYLAKDSGKNKVVALSSGDECASTKV